MHKSYATGNILSLVLDSIAAEEYGAWYSCSVYLLTVEHNGLTVWEDADGVARQIVLHTSEIHNTILFRIGIC